MNLLLFALWFFIPVGIANMAPVLVAKIPGLQGFQYPLDFYQTYRGKRVFGAHKTFRGLLAGIIMATLTVLLQQVVFQQASFLRTISLIDYSQLNALVLGTASACGALFGDAIESFFKRQINVPPGQPWFPFDQLDYIIGGIIATFLYIQLPLITYGVILLVYFGLHLFFTWLGYMLGLKDSPI